MWATNNNAAKGAWAFITPFLSFISSNAAGKTLKFAAIGVTNVPQNPAVNANIEHITGSPPWANTNGRPIPAVITENQ